MKKRDKIEGPGHQRLMQFTYRADHEGDDDDNRTIEISVSSEEPVDRWFGAEVLVHDKKSIDLKFFGGGSAPLLLDHDPRRQIGVVEKATLDTKTRKVRATVRFSKNDMASEVLDDIKDGIRSNVSVGYAINKTEHIEEDGKIKSVRVIDWSPMEVSIVSIPADQSVGVGRSASDPTLEIEPKPKENVMSEPKVIDEAAIRREAMADAERIMAEKQVTRDAAYEAAAKDRDGEIADIMDLGQRHNMSKAATEAVRAGSSLSVFRGTVLDNVGKDTPLDDVGIGMTKREATEDFSIMRLLSAKVGGTREREAAKFELEACQAAEEALPSDYKTQGFRMPQEVMDNWGTRVLAAGTDTQLIDTEHRAGSFIDALRNSMSVMQAGATMLGGLSGNVDIPGKNAVSTATWLTGEGVDATGSEPTFRTVALTPKDLAVYTDMTRRMRQQSSPDIEALVRADIAFAMALGIDLAALEGTGANGQPTGVLNQTGVNAPTAFAAVNPTFAEVVAMETAIADDNALMGNLAYIGRTNMYGALKTTKKDAGSGEFVVEPGGTVNGYRYLQSNQGTDGNLYFGNWSDVLIGTWGGLDLVVDEAALALSNGLRLLAFQTCDVAVRHAQSFAFNNDGV